MRSGLTRALALALLACAAGPLRAQAIDTTVSAGNAPLAGVAVTVQYRHDPRAAGTTDAAGRLHLDLPKLLGERVPERDAVTLSFRKQGYEPLNRLFKIGTPGDLAVAMTDNSASQQLTPAEVTALAPLRSTGAIGPLMLLPYQFAGVASIDQINQNLRANLERRIVTYVQSATGGSASGLGLRLAPLGGAHDIAQMQAYGRHANVLAVVGGDAFAPAGGLVRVTSRYVIIPKAAGFEAPVAYVDDSLPAEALASPDLHQRLKQAWGRLTLLAVAIRDINAAPAAPAPQRKAALARVRQYLSGERSAAGPNSNDYVPELNALIAQLDKELQ